ncbi:alpha/beta hydrolase [Nocardioides alcanivorans]|uniref:alpha/beta hydrolase n=1 Tax=Nocardioides alcanivorans TaxID=2897352 RepID=UPI001F405D52|nr:alpha/beta hydrolase [Nocardioides alcanivorans]
MPADPRAPFAPPASISPEAQQVLAAPSAFDVGPKPESGSATEWQRWVDAMDAALSNVFGQIDFPAEMLARSQFEIDGVTTYVLRPGHVPDDGSAPIIVEFHGGGLALGGGELAWQMAAGRAVTRNAITWVTDYRMPPRHPFPAALDDCTATYRRALEERSPSRVALLGASAGGNLAAAVVLRAKDEGTPLPAALVLLTPEVDLTESGDTFATLLGVDPFLGSLAGINELYAGTHDLDHPYLSPLFGDVSGFPPTFLQTGTRDLYLSNTVRMHRRLLDAGVPVELRVMEGAPHGGFGGRTPEDKVIADEVLAFCDLHLGI